MEICGDTVPAWYAAGRLEAVAAMMLMDRLKSMGVEVGDDSITVPLGKGDDER